MSRTSNFDSEFYNPVYHFDSPSYGRQSTRKPFDVPKEGEERKEAVIIVVLILGILIFFVIKLIIDHYKRSKNSTDCNRTTRSEVMRAESSRVRLPCHRINRTRDDACRTNHLNGIRSYGSSEAQVRCHDMGYTGGFSHELDSRNGSPLYGDSVHQHQVLLDVLGTDVHQDCRRLSGNQSYRTSSPSIRLHLRDDDLIVDQRSNRSFSCQDLPPSYDMITECSILNSSSLLSHAESGPAVLDLTAPPSYTDVIRSQVLLSGHSADIELFSNEGERENGSCRC